MSETKKDSKGVIIKLVNVRFSFPHLFERDSFKRYSCNFLIEPGSEQDKAIGAAINQAARNAWGENAGAKLKQFKAQDEICYRDGDNKIDKDGDVVGGYAGKKFLTGTSQVQPTLLNETRDEITKESGKLFSGAYGTVIVDIWPQNGPKYYGIRCQLQGVQHYKDGDSFGGGRRASASEFDDAPGAVDAGDDSDLVGGNPDDDILF